MPAPITTFADPGATIEDLSSITAGPDGRLWFTDPDTDRIARITPAGVITTFRRPGGDRLHQRARRDHLRTGRQHLVHEQR